jgi:hypothetical protein
MKKELREKVWNKFNSKCAYCGEDLEYNKMEVDHKIPIYRNHSDEELLRMNIVRGTNEFKNLLPSCKQCNYYKSTFSIAEFKNQLYTIIERIKKPFIVRLAIKYGLISFKTFDGKFYYETQNK